MKIKQAIFVLLIFSSCTLKEENRKIKEINSQLRMELDSILASETFMLQKAIEFERQDSINQAKEIFIDLTNAQNPMIMNIAKTNLAMLTDKKVLNGIHKNLEGEWGLIWEGSNWGTSYSTDINHTNRKIRFDDEQIIFYLNDKIIRQTKIKLYEPKIDGSRIDYPFLRDHLKEEMMAKWNVQFGLIKFEDNQNYKSFYLKDNILTLTIPGCECGCLEVEYEKIKISR